MMGGSFKIVPAVGLHFKKKRHKSVFVYKEKKNLLRRYTQNLLVVVSEWDIDVGVGGACSNLPGKVSLSTSSNQTCRSLVLHPNIL